MNKKLQTVIFALVPALLLASFFFGRAYQRSKVTPPATVFVPAPARTVIADPPPPPAPVPTASAAPAPPTEPAIDPVFWSTRLPGRWVHVENGDAIPGGKIVDGGVRLDIVKGRPGSKTPWNLTFWAPKTGHREATTISAGCGFYESGTCYCRGYGLPATPKAERRSVSFYDATSAQHEPAVHVVVEGLLDAVVRKP